MNTFNTLLLREWMQHQRGWLILAGLPVVILLITLSVGDVNLGNAKGPGQMGTPVAGMMGMGALASTLALMWIAVLLQAPGLARRDMQDRSIEFWLSLPTHPAQSLAATLVAHLVLAPWFGLLCGLAAAALVAPLGVFKALGTAGLAAADWGQLITTGLALGARLAVGIVLATLWASPLILGLMAASAWLKRWGVPAVIGLIAVGGGLERLVLGTQWLHRSVGYLAEEAAVALIGASAVHGKGVVINEPSELAPLLSKATSWMLADLGAALQNLLHPGFAAAVAVGAAMFVLLVLRRQRGG